MKILVFTPVWKRPEITEAYCLGILRLKKKFNIDVMCVLSGEDYTHGHQLNHELMKKYGIDYVEYKNKLGAKKNYGLNCLMKKDFDYLMEMNSDDIILDELLEVYKDLMEKGEPFIGIGNFVFYNSEDGNAKECKSTTLFGIGRAYKKDAIKKAAKYLKVSVLETFVTKDNYHKKGEEKWIHHSYYDEDKMEIIDGPSYKLWNDHADYGMDNESEKRFARVGIFPKIVHTDEPLAMDVKSKINIWSFDQMRGDGYNSKNILSRISKEEKDYLDGLRIK